MGGLAVVVEVMVGMDEGEEDEGKDAEEVKMGQEGLVSS